MAGPPSRSLSIPSNVRTDETPVQHVHLSGKFDRAPELLRVQVHEATEAADVITLTEVDHAARGAVLAIAGWTITRGDDGPRGETAILTRNDVWRVLAWEVIELADNVPAARSRIVVPIALLEHVSSASTLLLTAGHLPASVEGDWRARTARVVSHMACVLRWRRTVRAWQDDHHPDALLAVADWNLNLLRVWVRAWVRTAWPSMRPPSRKGTPDEGDLGPRLISWAVGHRIRGLVLQVLDENPASDHRGVRLDYAIGHRVP
jgi:hypothetical protein